MILTIIRIKTNQCFFANRIRLEKRPLARNRYNSCKKCVDRLRQNLKKLQTVMIRKKHYSILQERSLTYRVEDAVFVELVVFFQQSRIVEALHDHVDRPQVDVVRHSATVVNIRRQEVQHLPGNLTQHQNNCHIILYITFPNSIK